MYAGTSWEGVGWKRKRVPQTEFGQSFKLAVQDANKRATMMAFVVLFPIIAILTIALAISPASAGSCVVDTVPPTHRSNNPIAKGVAHCRDAGGHSHYLWVKLKKDTLGWPNKTVKKRGISRSSGNFSTTASGWAGPGWYYTYAGVRWQDKQASSSIHWG